MSKTILSRSLAFGLNLLLIWLRLLVFNQINQGQQNAGVTLKIMFRALTMKVTTIDILVMVNLINNLEDRMADRSHTELFSLLPSVCLSKQFDIN